MANTAPVCIERYTQLYEYIEAELLEYRIARRTKTTIEVHRLAPSGGTLVEEAQDPAPHDAPCIHYFHDHEVTNPSLVIPQCVAEDLVHNFCMPRDIFVILRTRLES